MEHLFILLFHHTQFRSCPVGYAPNIEWPNINRITEIIPNKRGGENRRHINSHWSGANLKFHWKNMANLSIVMVNFIHQLTGMVDDQKARTTSGCVY